MGLTIGFLVKSLRLSTKTKTNKRYSVFRGAVYEGEERNSKFVPANVSYKVVLFCYAALRRFYLFVECVFPAKAALITVVGAERRLEAAL